MLKLTSQQINAWKKQWHQHDHMIIRRGLEKEGLRVDQKGVISQKPHPETLGSKLTHPYITTDYSESLLEFVTPVHCEISKTLGFLTDLHHFTYQNLSQELIWPNSMPSILNGNSSVPIAYFGTSNSGQIKEVYRRGLDLRYGRIMQTIAGIHYNFSFTDDFWQWWADWAGLTLTNLVEFRSQCYMRMIRNFHRCNWLLMYLFGASPVFDKSFLSQQSEAFSSLGQRSVLSPYASSLRMSDLGYHNNVQNQLNIDFNSLSAYVKTLRHAVNTPWPAYEKLGVEVDGFWRQLNGNILQIENEFYGDIRPKRITQSGQTPTCALASEGIQYIEVRCLDINPLLPLGIDENEIRFIDAFLLRTLLMDDEAINPLESKRLTVNRTRVVNQGREAHLRLLSEKGEISLQEAAINLMDEIAQCADLLDSSKASNLHAQAIEMMRARIDLPELTPAGEITRRLKEKNEDFIEWNLTQASAQADYFRQQNLSLLSAETLKDLVQSSWQQQSALEHQPQESFAVFLEKYFAQNKCSGDE